jgi:hypothetical protein
VPVTAVAAHPGVSNTGAPNGGFLEQLVMNILAQPAAMGALPQLYAATAQDVAGGDYFGPGGMAEVRGYPTRVGYPPRAKNEADGARLWTISEKLTGVSYLD